MIRRGLVAASIFLWFFLLTTISSSAEPEKRSNLDELVNEALQKNPEILAARKRWEAYRERVPQAGALEDPMVGFGIINLPTDFSFRDEDMTMKEFSISQRLPFPGKRPLMRGMAEKEAEAVLTEVERKTLQVIRDVNDVYHDLSHYYRTNDVTQRNKAILENFAKIAETRYSVGEGVQQDVLKAHVEVSKMVDELLMLAQRKRALEARLNASLDRPIEAPMAEPEEVAFKRVLLDLEELRRVAVETNPVLQGMRKMIEAKEKAYLLARREYYPDFNVRFAYGQRDNGPEMSRRDMLSGMVEVNIPVFFGSKQDRKVAETKADIMNAEARYRAMKNEIFSVITDMSSMIERLDRQLELYRLGIIPQARLQVNSAMSSYRVNKVDFMTLLDAQMTLYRYELEYHQALTEYEKGLAALGTTVGRRSLQPRQTP